ncbi:unnamed protein product [Caenorhabditis auriculariae]|uniref:Uncharacterized protein n=1 Tax=Caenorhabditis auriculariae TaxID=2777116 RepID=A0A8S1GNB8_9PELO|nr:unnamed protein product [Caenorhabditis auriculariae]
MNPTDFCVFQSFSCFCTIRGGQQCLPPTARAAASISVGNSGRRRRVPATDQPVLARRLAISTRMHLSVGVSVSLILFDVLRRPQPPPTPTSTPTLHPFPFQIETVSSTKNNNEGLSDEFVCNFNDGLPKFSPCAFYDRNRRIALVTPPWSQRSNLRQCSLYGSSLVAKLRSLEGVCPDCTSRFLASMKATTDGRMMERGAQEMYGVPEQPVPQAHVHCPYAEQLPPLPGLSWPPPFDPQSLMAAATAQAQLATLALAVDPLVFSQYLAAQPNFSMPLSLQQQMPEPPIHKKVWDKSVSVSVSGGFCERSSCQPHSIVRVNEFPSPGCISFQIGLVELMRSLEAGRLKRY